MPLPSTPRTGRSCAPPPVEQRDTTPAARAKREATRVAAHTKEEKGRPPPPGFKPKGERATPAAEEAVQAAPVGCQRQAPKSAAAAPARATPIPPGFGEYSPNDPRYQGLTDAEQMDVQVELLDPHRTGPVAGNVVRCRDAGPAGALSVFYADVLLAKEVERAGGGAGGEGGGPADAPPFKMMMGGQRCPSGRPRSSSGRGTPGTMAMKARATIPSSTMRCRTFRCCMKGTRPRGNPQSGSPRKACSTLRTSSSPWPRVGERGCLPTMKATPMGKTSCPRGQGGAMGHGPTRRSRNYTAFSVTWGGNGFKPMPTHRMEKM